MEELYGPLGIGAEYAVGMICEIAQVAQPLLHRLNAQTAAPALERAVGVILRKPALEDDALEVRVSDAVGHAAQIVLQELNGAVGARAEDAVNIVLVIAQIVKGLLDGAHSVPSAAPHERGILRRRLQAFPCGGLAVDGDAFQQTERRLQTVGCGSEFDEAEIGCRGALGEFRVYVQLAAHALDAQSGHIEAFGQIVAVQIRKATKRRQRTARLVQAIDLPARVQHEQRALGRGQLVFQSTVQRQHHAPAHVIWIIDLKTHGAGSVTQVVDPAVEHAKGQNV